jgi:chaperone BCS1
MDALKNILSPLGMNTGAIQDTLVRPLSFDTILYKCNLHLALQKLVVIGGTVETARRASVSAWNGFVDCEPPRPYLAHP